MLRQSTIPMLATLVLVGIASTPAAAQEDRVIARYLMDVDASQIDPADLPPHARPGECFTRIFVPPSYQTETERVLVREAAERLELSPAQYETVTERVMVKPQTVELVEVPAQYDWVEDTVQVASATTEWKMTSDCGPTNNVRNVANNPVGGTGECLCLVEIPAKYDTVRRRVMTQPPTVREIAVPAAYETIRKTVVARQADVRRIAIPAEYETITREVKVSDATVKWAQTECGTQQPLYDKATIRSLQRNLNAMGYSCGPTDGVMGQQTRQALIAFQRDNRLRANGTLDNATLVAINR